MEALCCSGRSKLAKMTKYTRTENNLVFAAVLISAALYLVFVSDDPVGVEGAAPPMWVHLILAAGFAVLTVRSLRGGAYAGDESLKIRNMSRTYIVPWSEIAGFAKGCYPVIGYPSANVVLKSGRQIRMTMLAPPNPAFRPKNTETEVLLNQLAKELEAKANRS